MIWGCFRNPKTRFAGGLFDPNFDLYSDRSGYSRKYQSWWCHLVFLRCLGSVKYVRSAFLTHGSLKATGVPLQCPSCSAIAFLMGELEIGKDVVWVGHSEAWVSGGYFKPCIAKVALLWSCRWCSAGALMHALVKVGMASLLPVEVFT